MSDRCVFCGGRAVEGHHPTGRAIDKCYLDPEFVVPACRRCNCLDHHTWRVAGLDHIRDPNVARLRRTALFLARLADVGRSLPAEGCAGVASCLGRVADALD
jgi:hypothetical protein